MATIVESVGFASSCSIVLIVSSETSAKDLFFFNINDNGSISALAGYSCSDSFETWSNGVGAACAARIIKDGWKITYNWW